MSLVQLLVGNQGKGLEADRFTGIVGLTLQNDPSNRMIAFIEQFLKSKELNPVFSFYLPKN